VCGSVWKCVAVLHSKVVIIELSFVLQCVAVCCSVFAVCCSVLPRVAVCCSITFESGEHRVIFCVPSGLQRVAVYCSALQCALQHVAVCCSVLQRIALCYIANV